MPRDLPPPERPVWTVAALQIYIEQLVAVLRERVEADERRHDAQVTALGEQFRREGTMRKEAVEQAFAASEESAEKRFDAFAQFRDETNRTAATLINRQELNAALSVITEKVTAILSRLDKIEGKSSGISTLMASLLAGAGASAAIVSVVVLLTRHA